MDGCLWAKTLRMSRFGAVMQLFTGLSEQRRMWAWRKVFLADVCFNARSWSWVFGNNWKIRLNCGSKQPKLVSFAECLGSALGWGAQRSGRSLDYISHHAWEQEQDVADEGCLVSQSQKSLKLRVKTCSSTVSGVVLQVWSDGESFSVVGVEMLHIISVLKVNVMKCCTCSREGSRLRSSAVLQLFSCSAEDESFRFY